MKLFIYGGSFDPVHLGHEAIVNYVLPKCDKLLIVPTNKSPNKRNAPLIASFHRYKMLKLLFESSKKIEVLRYELDQEESAFTYDTIKFVKSKYVNFDITLIMGFDLFEDLNNWYNINKIKKMVNFIVFNRNKNNINDLDDFKVEFIKDFELLVSSSKVRDLFNEDEKDLARSMLPPLVYEYLIKEKIFSC